MTPKLDKTVAVQDFISRMQVDDEARRVTAKELLFAVDVTEPDEVLIKRFVDILRRAEAKRHA